MSTTPAPTGTARPGHVLVVGEALIDVVHRADGSVDEHPGGSLANVALTLGRLGRDARLATWVADDAHGAAVRAWLDDSAVTLAPGSTGADRTSVATAHLDAHGAATYEFDLEWRVPPGTAADAGTLAVHTGSIAAVLEPGASDVRALVATARDTATVTYDPNARPALMGDPVDARSRIEALVALADVVKVSDEDVAWLVPGADPVAVARDWLALGPALVVVTLGGEGAVAVAAAGEQRVTAPRVEVVDTVGAGDSFMGALLDGLWDAGLLGADRRDALRAIDAATLAGLLERCVAVAAITVSRAGANPPRRAELAPA
ncbi:carbohydrate kinase [Cellulosimicrobium sp. BIT-GX5]|uniref:Carbohydrate kinase n=1 Tax=Cellulosimicrobium composti TaxID=2672572 RepID=A0A6N7ZHH6_9MICO|nr:carbohydrate kinase [Cellulosimicrobium composti]MTG88904.1 carbohydrate kinase [Cellulosimicrobium composti]